MDFYSNELAALKRSGRYRERQIYDSDIIDLASNDYLGLSENSALLKQTYRALKKVPYHASKASMLVNGYHPIHATVEEALCAANGFDSGVILGSGFNANIAMIEALVRKGDEIFLDEKYHASGVLASKMVDGKVSFFAHNDADDLRQKMMSSSAKRKLIAVEGIYSMDGDRLSREIIELADEFTALLIVDEAHSSGVIGKKLMGIFDAYAIAVKPHYIKMGTLGKAYGSFGAYILASEHIVDYLINRAKPIIYATAPSLFDTLLGHYALEYILENTVSLEKKIRSRQQIIKEGFGMEIDGLIAPVLINDNSRVLAIRDALLRERILVGAIRQPTVDRAIIRLIARVGTSKDALQHAVEIIKKHI